MNTTQGIVELLIYRNRNL